MCLVIVFSYFDNEDFFHYWIKSLIHCKTILNKYILQYYLKYNYCINIYRFKHRRMFIIFTMFKLWGHFIIRYDCKDLYFIKFYILSWWSQKSRSLLWSVYLTLYSQFLRMLVQFGADYRSKNLMLSDNRHSDFNSSSTERNARGSYHMHSLK